MRENPVTYKGVEYRSFLEARWAIFFEKLKIPNVFEPKTYFFGSTLGYLPDFYLPRHDKFVEIKPFNPDEEEILKASLLVELTGKPVLFLCGSAPYPWKYSVLPVVPSDAAKFRKHAVPMINKRHIGWGFAYGKLTDSLYVAAYRKKIMFYPLQSIWYVDHRRLVTERKEAEPEYNDEIQNKQIEWYIDPATIRNFDTPLRQAYLAATEYRFGR